MSNYIDDSLEGMRVKVPSGTEKYEYRLMKLKWSDVTDIAILLEEKYPNEDNVNLRFTDLHRWVVNLNEFDDTPEASNEKILEAIQMAWIDERD